MEDTHYFAVGLVSWLAGMIMATALITFASPEFKNLQYARQNYTRCLSDGGTEQHCIGKYLLPEKGSDK